MSNGVWDGPRVVDQDYLTQLETKLKNLKNPAKTTNKQFLSDLASFKDHQLFNLLSASNPTSELKFEDDFSDIPVDPNYIQRKIAPQTCAINKGELLNLTKHDSLQKTQEPETSNSGQEEAPNDAVATSKICLPLKKKEKTEAKFKPSIFLPLKDCFDVIIIKDVLNSKKHVAVAAYDGVLHVSDPYGKNRSTIELFPHLDEMAEKPENTIEFVCCDISTEKLDDCIALLGTCWVELDEMRAGLRYFGAIFCIRPDLTVTMTSKINFDRVRIRAIACCRMADKQVFNSERSFITFPTNSQAVAYILKNDFTLEIYNQDESFDAFPELSLTAMPGTAVRAAYHISSVDHRWTCTGFDTGYAVLSVTDPLGNIIDRKPLRFFGPVSVLEFLPTFVPENRVQYENYLFVSSTIGPAAIWRYRLDSDAQTGWTELWNFEQAGRYDAITSAVVLSDTIFLTTYAGALVGYWLPTSENFNQKTFEPASYCRIDAPVINCRAVNDDVVAVLTTKGLQMTERRDATTEHSSP